MDKYLMKQSEAEAVQFDGSKAHGYEILGWIYRLGGHGMLDLEENLVGSKQRLIVESNRDKFNAYEGDWVVYRDRYFRTFKDQEFHDLYESKEELAMRNG